MGLFHALVDYAGLFPPARLAMQQAVAEYLAARAGPHRAMLGRFIVRASGIEGLLEAMPAKERFALCVVLDGGIAALAGVGAAAAADRRITVETLEISLGPDELPAYADELHAANLSGATTYVETSAPALARVAAAGFGGKIRCGGVEPSAYPPPERVTEFLVAAVAAGVAFKATAGLHHPVRHFNPTAGVTMHGFLNLLAATALARAGAPGEEILQAVRCEDASQFGYDGAVFRFGERAFGPADVETLRRESFVAYGSCSFEEPVEDLRALGMIA